MSRSSITEKEIAILKAAILSAHKEDCGCAGCAREAEVMCSIDECEAVEGYCKCDACEIARR